MKKDENIVNFSADELRKMQAESITDSSAGRAMSEEELERLIADDPEERDLRPDWTIAELVLPKARQSVHLRLEQETIDFFKSGGISPGCKPCSGRTRKHTAGRPDIRDSFSGTPSRPAPPNLS